MNFSRTLAFLLRLVLGVVVSMITWLGVTYLTPAQCIAVAVGVLVAWNFPLIVEYRGEEEFDMETPEDNREG